MMRRGLGRAIGGWRPARDCYGESSQDFLHRAWKAGYEIRANEHLGVLAMQSGDRDDCYTRGAAWEHEYYARCMAEDSIFRERILMQMLAERAGRVARARVRLDVPSFRQLLYRPSRWLGLAPRAVESFFEYGRPGGQIRALNARRGLGSHHGGEGV
jgi:hypothetical protein